MSKAFLRESDFPDPSPPVPVASSLPDGAKNYITPEGAEKLRAELDELKVQIRPPLASEAATDIDAKSELQRVDQRIRHLNSSLRTAEIVGPPIPADPVVRFGSNVTVRDDTGVESTYRLVGVDETLVEKGWISWVSPLARALINSKAGDVVQVRTPSGLRSLQIVRVDYDSARSSSGMSR
jgi:transcription elongation factor GreB